MNMNYKDKNEMKKISEKYSEKLNSNNQSKCIKYGNENNNHSNQKQIKRIVYKLNDNYISSFKYYL